MCSVRIRKQLFYRDICAVSELESSYSTEISMGRVSELESSYSTEIYVQCQN